MHYDFFFNVNFVHWCQSMDGKKRKNEILDRWFAKRELYWIQARANNMRVTTIRVILWKIVAFTIRTRRAFVLNCRLFGPLESVNWMQYRSFWGTISRRIHEKVFCGELQIKSGYSDMSCYKKKKYGVAFEVNDRNSRQSHSKRVAEECRLLGNVKSCADWEKWFRPSVEN